MADDSELLFFDTFSHESCELNLDLVQFPRPVYIFEIRVIPLGAHVQADFPGGHRLGATNPSSFQLEFFVNDLSKRSASTFVRLGNLPYKQNAEIQFPVQNKIPTDGLVLRGLYSAVTLAVYGILTKTTTKERSSPPPPPPPPSQPVPHPQSQDHRIESSAPPNDWDRLPRTEELPSQPSHARSQPLLETPRFAEMPPNVHPKPDSQIQYAAEMAPPPPVPVYSEPPQPLVYPDCIPTTVPVVPPQPPPQVPYQQYDNRYGKPWPPPEEQHYQSQTEGYDSQVYTHSPETTAYQAPPPVSIPHQICYPKEIHPPPEISRPDRDPYDQNVHDHKIHSRDKDRDRRDKLWERDRDRDRDGHSSDDLSRDRDYKRKERDRHSWERNSPERYRDRDRDRPKDQGSRDRDRDRDRSREAGREKPRGHDMYERDRNLRGPPKRPITPPTPPPPTSSTNTHPRMPKTPPDIDKPSSGPRTPKEEEPPDAFDDRMRPEDNRSHVENYFESSAEHRPPGEPPYNLSEGEIQEGDNTEDDDGYEEIVSEEEIMSDGEEHNLDLVDMEYDISDETWNYMSSFNPYHCELVSYQYFSDPTLSLFEISDAAKSNTDDSALKANDLMQKENGILSMINMFQGKEHTEKWIESVERITVQLLAEDLPSIKVKDVYSDVVKTLIDWVVEGLDFDCALKQPHTVYKVRHIKAAIRLASVLFQTNAEIIDKLLEHEVPKLLLQLLDQPCMTLPIKLLIFRALDAVTFTKAGVNFLLKKVIALAPPVKFDFNPKRTADYDENHEIKTSIATTGYQKLLEILLSKQLTRAIVSLTALVEKIHLYEVLQELQETVDRLMQTMQNLDKSATTQPVANSDSHLAPAEPEHENADIPRITACSQDIKVIITCIGKLTSAFHNAWKELAQPRRYLPARAQFDIPKSPFDPFPDLLRMLKENNLMENILSLVSSPAIIANTAVLSGIRNLLLEILHSQKGMLYMLSLPDVMNGIQKSLLQNMDDAREDGNEESTMQNLGMHIIHRLQLLLYIDALFTYHEKVGIKKELDDHDAIAVLHHIYTMTFATVGRQALIEILPFENNLKALLPFVQMTGDKDFDLKLSKSVSAGYAIELLTFVVSHSDSISLLENFSEALYELSQQEQTLKLQDFSQWMGPARKIPNYSHEAVLYLTGILKAHLEDAATLPPELITTVRILKYITVPPVLEEESRQLRYMYATIQLFSNDGMSSLLSILQQVCDTFMKPSHQSVALVGIQGVLLVELVKPIICMLKNILASLISCRQTEFNDLTAVPVLLRTYSLLFMIPPTSFSFHIAQLVQSDIIEAFLTYTQPSLGANESEEALSKSLWTQMMQEVLKYGQQTPRNFTTSLTILSELLPLPLPLQAIEPLSPDEIDKNLNHRKLWSAHLHAVSKMIHEAILSITSTSYQPLQQLLRRICIQLADLAAPTALVVVRAILDSVLETLISTVEPETKPTNEVPNSTVLQSVTPDPLPVKPCTPTAARILNLMSYLVSHAAIKIPLMHVLKGSTKADEKYTDVLTILLDTMNLPSEKPSHIQAQECIVSILQSLFDPDIGFVTLENGASVNEVLTNCLPQKEHMQQICGALIQHVGSHRHHYASILPSLRSLVMLTEHDYGFFHVKQGLERYPNMLLSLFSRLTTSFSKDNTDYLSTLSTVLEFLRLMVNGYEEGAQTGRSMLLAPSELATLLKRQPHVSKEKKEKDQDSKCSTFPLLLELEKILVECNSEEEAVDSLLESVSTLILLLNDAAGKEDKNESNEILEPLLPQAEALPSQFSSRSVFILGEIDEERLSPAYWLSIPVADEPDQEQEQVTIDLVELSEKYISGDFDLKCSMENLCSSVDGGPELKEKDKSLGFTAKKKYLLNSGSAEIAPKRPFIAPMRGRGFSRATSHTSRANDPFRSRPPNTSRPPSMHVDDFVALESHHNDNTSQNPQKRQEGPRGRGRGNFDRGPAFPCVRIGGNNNGRFCSPPGPYSRREPTNRGSGRGAARISNNMWGGRTSSGLPKLPSGANIRTNFGNRPNIPERCAYNSPFVQPEHRLISQRNRDPYQELGMPPGAIPPLGRFSRGMRIAGGMGPPVQGHWQETRNKAQNQRFISGGSPGRGGGRRDMNGRHVRAFTR